MNKQKQAFTLVELIVVITILAILGTIAFVSLAGYSKDARNSTRLSDIGLVNTSLELFSIPVGKYPSPSDATDIMAGPVKVGELGVLGDSVTSQLERLSKKPIDPKTNEEYGYSITASKKSFQVLFNLEDGLASTMPQTYAATSVVPNLKGNYNDMYVQGSNGEYFAVPSLFPTTLDVLTADFILNEETNSVAFTSTSLGSNITSDYAGFVKKLQTSYSGAVFIKKGGIFTRLATLDTTNTGALVAFGSAVENGGDVGDNGTTVTDSSGSTLPVSGGGPDGIACPGFEDGENKCVFQYTGSVETITVTGTPTITVKSWGAGGAGGTGYGVGGAGAYVTGNITLTASDSLSIIVGEGGRYDNTSANSAVPYSAFGGGGQAALITSSTTRGGGGGGATYIQQTGTLLMATGAGGGAGGSNGPLGTPGVYGNGGNGGLLNGGNGTDATGSYPGRVGLGAQGATGGIGLGDHGSTLQGGGSNTYYGSGGGGSGYAGGSGAQYYCGGGGGSSFMLGGYDNINSKAGVGQTAQNISDPDYISGVGKGGNVATNGGNGLLIITW